MAQLTANLTTAELEARDTSINMLAYYMTTSQAEAECFEVGDNVTVNSSDGDIFIGHIEDVDYDRMAYYVELD